jgi:putative DNA primase/helicase
MRSTEDDMTRKPGLQAAMALLDDILHDFPFQTPCDRTHAICLFLLPLVRDLISGPTPLHMIESPVQGSGKTLLAYCLLGRDMSRVMLCVGDAERRKILTSTLAKQPSAILIENAGMWLRDEALAGALTADRWEGRMLGKAEAEEWPIRCAWVATANNPTISPGIARRCVHIRLDPQVERPWMRTDFLHRNIRSYVEGRRQEMAEAARVMIQKLIHHGPPGVGPMIGGYEAWSSVMGGICGAVGLEGFLENTAECYEAATGGKSDG